MPGQWERGALFLCIFSAFFAWFFVFLFKFHVNSWFEWAWIVHGCYQWPVCSFLFSGIQLAGHSAGAHLAACLFDKLVQQSSASIVKSLYFISGVYDVSELRYMPSVNPNNILSLDENNGLRLSPILFDLDKWTAASTAVRIFVASHDAPKLVGQAHCFERLLAMHRHPNHRLLQIENTDHFDIVENLSKRDFFITQQIINEAKLFANWLQKLHSNGDNKKNAVVQMLIY